jgi:hypothetical protein
MAARPCCETAIAWQIAMIGSSTLLPGVHTTPGSSGSLSLRPEMQGTARLVRAFNGSEARLVAQASKAKL